jgi:hypothetical protein
VLQFDIEENILYNPRRQKLILILLLQMGHDELFQRISVDLGLNNAFIGLKMSSKLNDLPEHFTPRPELQVTFNEKDARFLPLNQNVTTRVTDLDVFLG